MGQGVQDLAAVIFEPARITQGDVVQKVGKFAKGLSPEKRTGHASVRPVHRDIVRQARLERVFVSHVAFGFVPDVDATLSGDSLQQGGLSRAILAHEKNDRALEDQLRRVN